MAQDQGKLCVVIDLDETLVHSSFKVPLTPAQHYFSMFTHVSWWFDVSAFPSCRNDSCIWVTLIKRPPVYWACFCCDSLFLLEKSSHVFEEHQSKSYSICVAYVLWFMAAMKSLVLAVQLLCNAMWMYTAWLMWMSMPTISLCVLPPAY